jgi:hypothetical protein
MHDVINERSIIKIGKAKKSIIPLTLLVQNWMVTRGGAKLNLLTEVTRKFCIHKKLYVFAQCEDIPGGNLIRRNYVLKKTKYSFIVHMF